MTSHRAAQGGTCCTQRGRGVRNSAITPAIFHHYRATASCATISGRPPRPLQYIYLCIYRLYTIHTKLVTLNSCVARPIARPSVKPRVHARGKGATAGLYSHGPGEGERMFMGPEQFVSCAPRCLSFFWVTQGFCCVCRG